MLASSGAIAAGLAPLGLRGGPRPGRPAGRRLGRAGPARRPLHRGAGQPRGVAGQVLLTDDDVTAAPTTATPTRPSPSCSSRRAADRQRERHTWRRREIRFGDNDRLAALVATWSRRPLVLLSDVTACTTPPGTEKRRCPGGRGGRGRGPRAGRAAPATAGVGTGGMQTKLEAARIATEAGIPVVLTRPTRSRRRSPVAPVGTLFHATGRRRPPGCCGWRTPPSQGLGGARRRCGPRRGRPPGLAARRRGHRGHRVLRGRRPVDLVGPEGRPWPGAWANFDAEELPALLGRSSRDLKHALAGTSGRSCTETTWSCSTTPGRERAAPPGRSLEDPLGTADRTAGVPTAGDAVPWDGHAQRPHDPDVPRPRGDDPHAAEAVDAMTARLGGVGNPNSLHASGRDARRVVEESREAIAGALGARPPRWSSPPAAPRPTTWPSRECWSPDGRPGRTGILSSERGAPRRPRPVGWLADHEGAERDRCRWTGRAGRHRGVRASIERDRQLRRPGLADVGQQRGRHAAAVSRGRRIAAEHGIPLHSDAVQAVGAVPVDFGRSGLDALTVYRAQAGRSVRRRRAGRPARGRGHPAAARRRPGAGVRSGTLDAPAIAGFAAAVEQRSKRRRSRRRLARCATACSRRRAAVARTRSSNGHPEARSGCPATRHLTFPGCEGDSLLMLLDAQGSTCSTGSACQRRRRRSPHVLLAMGCNEDARPRLAAVPLGDHHGGGRRRPGRRHSRPCGGAGRAGPPAGPPDEGPGRAVRRRGLGRGRRARRRRRPRRHRGAPGAVARTRSRYRSGARGLLHDRGRPRRPAGRGRARHPVLRLGHVARSSPPTSSTTSSPSTPRAAPPTRACGATSGSSSRPSWTGRWALGLRRGVHRALRPAGRPRTGRRAAPGGRSRQGPVLRARACSTPTSWPTACSRSATAEGRRARRGGGPGAAVAAKPDSHDICFIADGDTGAGCAERLGRTGSPVGRRHRRRRHRRGGRLARGHLRVHGRSAAGGAAGASSCPGRSVRGSVLDIEPVSGTVTVGPRERLEIRRIHGVRSRGAASAPAGRPVRHRPAARPWGGAPRLGGGLGRSRRGRGDDRPPGAGVRHRSRAGRRASRMAPACPAPPRSPRPPRPRPAGTANLGSRGSPVCRGAGPHSRRGTFGPFPPPGEGPNVPDRTAPNPRPRGAPRRSA